MIFIIKIFNGKSILTILQKTTIFYSIVVFINKKVLDGRLNMKRKKSTVVLIWIIVALIAVIVFKIKGTDNNKGFKVVKWNNFYKGDNIKLYYGSTDKQLLKQLNEKYNLKKITEGGKNDFDKSLKILDWINKNMPNKDTMDYDENIDYSEEGTFDILSQENKNTYSSREICIVFNEFAIASGIISRIGELSSDPDSFTRKEGSMIICEVWSNDYNKWIMIDATRGAYMEYNNIPLSAIEVIERGLANIKIIGVKDNEEYEEYVDDVKKYFHNYLIKIDNSIYGEKNSNSYLCFINNKENKNFLNENSVKRPIIYTYNKNLFKLSPRYELNKIEKDEIPTLIFSKKNITKDDSDIKMEIYGGAFQDSAMINRYYISINNRPFKQQNSYFEVEIKEGITNIRLSKDGKSAIREVVFEFIE